MAQAFGSGAFQAMEEQVRKNMSFFTEAMRMFSPFPQGEVPGPSGAKAAPQGEEPSDLDTLKRQMADMQAKLDKLANK